MGERRVDWSALPFDLLHLIGEAIQDRNDVVRFRSVCDSWRRSTASPCIIPTFPLPLPSPTRSAGSADVTHRIFHRLKLVDDVNPNPSTCSSKSWLVKVEEVGYGIQFLLNPLSDCNFGFLCTERLLDYQVVQVSKEYELRSFSDLRSDDLNKLVLFPDSAWSSVIDTVFFALYDEGKLGYLKFGDKNWTLVDDLCHYDDIIVYKGKPYVVDNWGIVSWIDSSMKLIDIYVSPPLESFGKQKHLVESRGELYVVDRFFDTERRFDHHLREYRDCPNTFDFNVYKLDQECRRWVRVENLGDRVFILGKNSSFSVSATEFSGCKGNCIYFTYEDDNGVFDQKTGEIVDLQDWSHLFQLPPPPSWLISNLHLNVEFR